MGPFDLCSYSGNLKWLQDSTIFMVKHGSHAYGLNTETSDLDVKGVAIPPPPYFIGMQRFEQAEFKDVPANAEAVVYDIRKFCNLAADCNPNIIEVLWGSPDSYFYMTPLGAKLVQCRNMFLSKKARFTFAGYAHAQLKRIRLHHEWIRFGDRVKKPERSEFKLKEKPFIDQAQIDAVNAAINKKLDQWNLRDMTDLDNDVRIFLQKTMEELLLDIGVSMKEDLWIGAARTLGCDDNLIHELQKEREYASAVKDYGNYLTWKQSRNPTRAALEEKYGYDTKHGMHLVRLLKMCREIMETGNVIVKRPDREELLAIRSGAWSLEKLVEWATYEDNCMNELYINSKLPKSPNRDAIEKLMMELIEEFLNGF